MPASWVALQSKYRKRGYKLKQHQEYLESESMVDGKGASARLIGFLTLF